MKGENKLVVYKRASCLNEATIIAYNSLNGCGTDHPVGHRNSAGYHFKEKDEVASVKSNYVVAGREAACKQLKRQKDGSHVSPGHTQCTLLAHY